MKPCDIQDESDYRWLERAGIYAGDRKLTEHERMLVNQEVQAFEKKERNDTQHEDQSPTTTSNPKPE